MQLLCASSNKHKVAELQSLLGQELFTLTLPEKLLDVLEDGETFSENALKKARAYYEQFKVPVVADDSGLVVEALPGELAVQTARFGGDGLSAKERYELLLERMKSTPDDSRQAYFVCHLCFFLAPGEIFFFEGRVQGTIVRQAQGADGFGYDPVFSPIERPDKTLAQLPEWKELHSHRARAVKAAREFFKQRNCQRG